MARKVKGHDMQITAPQFNPNSSVNIVVPDGDTDKPILTIFPSGHDSLSACSHLQYRILMCKYRCGVFPTQSEQHTIDSIMRRLNRDLSKAVTSTSVSNRRAGSPADGFFIVDMENGGYSSTSNTSPPRISDALPNRSITDQIITCVFRFPLYLIFIVFITLYDMIVDKAFREHVRIVITPSNQRDEN